MTVTTEASDPWKTGNCDWTIRLQNMEMTTAEEILDGNFLNSWVRHSLLWRQNGANAL